MTVKLVVSAYLTLVFSSILLLGCTTPVPQVVPATSCTNNLKPVYFQACVVPELLYPGTTYEQALEDNAEISTAIRVCAERARVLQETLRACEKTR